METTAALPQSDRTRLLPARDPGHGREPAHTLVHTQGRTLAPPPLAVAPTRMRSMPQISLPHLFRPFPSRSEPWCSLICSRPRAISRQRCTWSHKRARCCHRCALALAVARFRLARSVEWYIRYAASRSDTSSANTEPLPADLLADASFLADTVRLLSGSHKLMGDMFWRDLELPVQRHLDLVNRESLGVTTTLHTRLSHIRPLAHSAAKKAAKRFAKTSNPVTDHKLAAARDDAHSLAAEVARLEHDAATAADRIAAPHLRAVVTLTGSVARSAAVSCTNLAAATQALVLVGSIGSRTARAMAPDMAAVANANADAAASAAAGWGIGVAPMPRGPSPVYPSGRMRTISGVSNSTGGYGGRGRAVSVASTTVSVADHVASKVPLEADAGDARRDMRARIFSMLSTDIGALAGEVVARSAV
ncbi:hypothetical protein BC828DRAFT_385561 [Blastocladiella britannica]|nr:hypothetical protein BC828DRAFT_385561 [Blastocladiella britannica]